MTIDHEIARATLHGGCLIAAPGATGKGGYRLICVDGRLVQLHRAVVEQELQYPLRPDELVLHSCHNPRCIRLTHLQIGTAEERSAAMVAAGRHAHGEGHPSHKLTEDAVWRLHRLRACGRGLSYRALGRLFGVSSTLARFICTGRKWKHVYDLLSRASA